MNRFSYICADPGIPIPGTKGASIHVASVCRALTEAGLDGEIRTLRPESDRLGELPVRPIPQPSFHADGKPTNRETRLFLGGLDAGAVNGERPDFIYERYSLWHVGGLARARAIGVPYILEVNSPLPVEAGRHRGLLHRRLADGVAELLLREADGVVCVSDEVASWVAERRENDRGVWVVPNGVDADLFSPEQPLADTLPIGGPLIAFCGSFRPWHGTDDLLDAFDRLVGSGVEDARLLCIGDGPQRGEFEKRAERLGHGDRLIMTGALPHDQVPGWLARADVAVAPYSARGEFYFSPLKIFEFLSLGLPVVAADLGQVRGLIEHGRRGLLYPPGDIPALAAALGHLIEDRDGARRLGSAGREWVLEHATWKKRVGEILERVAAL